MTPLSIPIANSIPSRSEIEGWSDEQRAGVARVLGESAGQPDIRVHRVRRGLVLLITIGGALALIPWIVYLNNTLPRTSSGGAWRATWIGFDIGLATVLAVTGWLVLHRRQLATIFLMVASTMLTVDAWFDVTLSWGTPEHVASLLTAGLAELPIAGFLLAVDLVMLKRIVSTVAALRGVKQERFSLWRAPTVTLGSQERTQERLGARRIAPVQARRMSLTGYRRLRFGFPGKGRARRR